MAIPNQIKTKNKIILEAETTLADNVAREWLSSLETRIDTINQRTKSHTIQIRELKKELKEVKQNEKLK